MTKELIAYYKWRAEDPLRRDDLKSSEERIDWYRNAPYGLDKYISRDIIYADEIKRWKEDERILKAGGNPYLINTDGLRIAPLPEEELDLDAIYEFDKMTPEQKEVWPQMKAYMEAQAKRVKVAFEEMKKEEAGSEEEYKKELFEEIRNNHPDLAVSRVEALVLKAMANEEQEALEPFLEVDPEWTEDVLYENDDRPLGMLKGEELVGKTAWLFRKKLDKNRKEWVRTGTKEEVEAFHRERRKAILENPEKFHLGEAVYDPFVQQRRDRILEEIAIEAREEINWDNYDQLVAGDAYPCKEENMDLLQKYLQQADFEFFAACDSDMHKEKMEKANVRSPYDQDVVDKMMMQKTKGALDRELTDLNLLPEGMTDGMFLMRKIRSQKSMKGQVVNFTQVAMVGNEKGTACFGIGKSTEPEMLNYRTIMDYRKNTLSIPLHEGRTISYPCRGSHGVTKVIIEPRCRGYGITAGPLMRAALGMFGIRDASGFMVGTEEMIPQLFAIWDALSKQKSLRSIALERGVNYYSQEPGVLKMPLPTHEQMRSKHNIIKGVVLDALKSMDERKGTLRNWDMETPMQEIQDGIWENIHEPSEDDTWPIFNRGPYSDRDRSSTPPFLPRPKEKGFSY
eukprot:gb/GEZN01001714.1/.p1 GENE.gb/GEZN01001714.1/~~gb/GEZN01001714.1/.p1  ORF type:complete len:624 (+),score=114.55 gb/GEZN01001714.1/:801-2672(+)